MYTHTPTPYSDLISPYRPQGSGGKASSTTVIKSSEDDNLAKGKSEMMASFGGSAHPRHQMAARPR